MAKAFPIRGNGKGLLYNMNGRLYDPLVGRFLSAAPYVQDGGLTQSYNRYSYCLNNPLRYTDYSGYTWGIFKPFVKAAKWVWNVGLPALDPVNFMQSINDHTEKLRKKMDELGVPDFSVGGTANLDGNVNVNGSINGHEVLNTQNIDRSGPSVEATYKMLTQVRKDYGPAWHAASRGGVNEIFVIGASLSVAEHTMYSKEFGTWMGKDMQIRSQSWGGNGITGGKNSFAKSTSGAIGIAGKVVGAYSMYDSYNEWQNGQINNTLFMGDMVSGLAGMFGGIYGASWSIGYDLGKSYGPSTWFAPRPQESAILEYLKTNKTGN